MTGSAASHDMSLGSSLAQRGLLGRAREFVAERPWALVVWGTMIAWMASLFAIAYDRYADLRYARLDLGNMVQAVWNTAHGHPLESTTGAGDQVVRLAAHVDPILAALAPLWIVAPSPLTLEAVQIVAVALGALPLFWLGRRHLGSERTAALLAIAYLAYPWLAWNAIDALHPVTLAIPLLLFCIWFLDTDRLVPFAICAVLVASTGELMGVTLAALGIWYAFARRRRREGLVIALAGMGWTLFALEVVVPHYSGAASVFYGPFDDVGGSPWGLLHTAITDPGAIVSAVSESRDFIYVFLLVAPLAAGFLLSPLLAAVALPQLAVNLLADDPGTTDPHEHYVAAVLPFLFAAAAIGLARLSESGRLRAVLLILTASVTASLMVGPWPGTVLGASAWDPLPSSRSHLRALEQAVSLVPDGAPVTSTNRIGARLAERRYLYSVPVIGRAEWVVLEQADVWIPQAYSGTSEPEKVHAFELEIRRSPAWQKVFDEDGVLVFRKVRE